MIAKKTLFIILWLVKNADVCSDRFSETGFLSWKEKCYITHAQQFQ